MVKINTLFLLNKIIIAVLLFIRYPWEKIKFKAVVWEEFLKILANPKFRVQEFALEVFREIFLWREKELKNKIFWN